MSCEESAMYMGPVMGSLLCLSLAIFGNSFGFLRSCVG